MDGHVEEHRHNSIDEFLAEWDRIGPAAEARLTGEQIFRPNLAADVICHEADLRLAEAIPPLVRYRAKRLPNARLVVRTTEGYEWVFGPYAGPSAVMTGSAADQSGGLLAGAHQPYSTSRQRRPWPISCVRSSAQSDRGNAASYD
jgi:hypothetical protein